MNKNNIYNLYKDYDIDLNDINEVNKAIDILKSIPNRVNKITISSLNLSFETILYELRNSGIINDKESNLLHLLPFKLRAKVLLFYLDSYIKNVYYETKDENYYNKLSSMETEILFIYDNINYTKHNKEAIDDNEIALDALRDSKTKLLKKM